MPKKNSYEVKYNLSHQSDGKKSSQGLMKIVQAESETNAITEVKKYHHGFVFDIVSVRLR